MAPSHGITIVASIFGLATVAVLLAANVLQLINWRNFDDLVAGATAVQNNEGYMYFGIVGSSISGLIYFLLFCVRKDNCGSFFYMLL